MKHRKPILVALAIALPLALGLTLRAVRSWQPRIIELAPVPTVSGIALFQNGRTDFSWRASGLAWCGLTAPGAAPNALTNWNGASIALRVLEAQSCDLNSSGALAALLRPNGSASGVQILDVVNARATAATRTLDASPDRTYLGGYALALSPDGTRLAGSLSYPRDLHPNAIGLFDARTGAPLARFVIPTRDEKGRGVSNQIWALAYSPDGTQLAVVGYSRVWIVDGRNGRLRRAWNKDGDATTRALWSPDGKTLGLASGHGRRFAFDGHIGHPRTHTYLSVHDARSGAVSFGWAQDSQSRIEAEGVTNFDFAPDGQALVWGTWRGSIQTADLATRVVENTYEMPPSNATPKITIGSTPTNFDNPVFVAYAPDGNTLAAAAPDRIVLWRVR